MTFYINKCSVQFQLNDPEVELFRKIIFSVIFFELFSVMVIRIMSGLKNYDIQMIKKGLEDKKKIEEKAIFQTMENLNMKELSHHNNTAFALINSSTPTGSKAMKILKKESINLNGIDTIDLKKGGLRDKKPYKNKQQKKEEKDSDQSNSSDDQSEISQQNDIESLEDSQIDQLQSVIESQKNFINFLNLRLNQSQASNFFNIILGHFFICAGFSLEQSPSLYSAMFCGGHMILFVVLVIVNAWLNDSDNKNKNENKEEKDKSNGSHGRCESQGIMMEKQNDNKKENVKEAIQKVSKRSSKKTVSLIIMGLMLLLNLSLLAVSITTIKRSYFNVLKDECQ